MPVSDYTVVVDTREQRPLVDEEDGAVVKTLLAGDYSILGYESRFALERKSLADLFQTVTAGHDRFHRELMRARPYDYFGLLIEGSWSSIQQKRFVGAQHSRVSGPTVAKIVATIHVRYGIPVWCCRDRAEARAVMYSLMSSYLSLFSPSLSPPAKTQNLYSQTHPCIA
jgi:DNA excision repair protein ERCC-4